MKDETYRLISLAQSGDKLALEQLTLENKGLIWSAVKRFSGRGVEQEDLFQIGAIGLIKAINKFDIEFNVEFSTYAIPMIFGEIRRFLRDDGIIKVSRTLKETAMSVRKAAEAFYVENGCEATINDLSKMTNRNKNDILLAIEATQPIESIYQSVYEGDNRSVLLLDKLNISENEEEKMLIAVSLKDAIENLPVKERQILILRYYKEKTQSEVARILGVSQVQISRLEKKILGLLRQKIS